MHYSVAFIRDDKHSPTIVLEPSAQLALRTVNDLRIANATIVHIQDPSGREISLGELQVLARQELED